jgi:hypothetical protein
MSVVSSSGRRRVLRGIVNGMAVSVGLPFLDCFLDSTGTALAATGQELPVCFGTWFWGCGLTPGRWEPKAVGANYDIQPELEPLRTYRNKINVLSGLRLFSDGKPFNPHLSGAMAVMTGNVPPDLTAPFIPSLDNIIAEKISAGTRFRSIEMSATGNARDCYSYRGGRVANSAEISPLALYQRLFGPGFVDPNKADFVPDAAVMLRHSALSGITEQRLGLLNSVGAGDRARLDEYFTSLRQLEQQLEVQLQKPAPLQACTIPSETKEKSTGQELTQVKTNHLLFAKLAAHALACNQTRVINMVFTNAISGLRKEGESSTHHILTHEESVDEKLGYQKRATWFLGEIVAAFGDFLKELDSIREGDRSLLDRTVIYATSEGGLAKLHSPENIPMLTAGSGNGRLKTGIHVARKGDSIARLGLTLQQAYGIPAAKWGTDSCETSKPITEILA